MDVPVDKNFDAKNDQESTSRYIIMKSNSITASVDSSCRYFAKNYVLDFLSFVVRESHIADYIVRNTPAITVIFLINFVFMIRPFSTIASRHIVTKLYG